jgi:predicted acylesterase/phospholipase RssA
MLNLFAISMTQFLHVNSLFNRAILTGVAIAIVLSSTLVGASERTRIGLVLGGGGARGAAHIGVLDVLKEQRIVIDCVSGTSMGALISGAFAAGLSPDEMISAMDRTNWRDMFNDNPPMYDTPSHEISLPSLHPWIRNGCHRKRARSSSRCR